MVFTTLKNHTRGLYAALTREWHFHLKPHRPCGSNSRVPVREDAPMTANLFDRLTAPPPVVPRPDPDAAYLARPRLLALRDAIVRAVRSLRPARWDEPNVFFFDANRQAELEAARPAPPARFAALAARIAAELPALVEAVELRRVARALDGLPAAARVLALHCPPARDLADLLAVPDDELFLALAPAARTGVRLHLRGAAHVGQLHPLLRLAEPVQLYAPAALRPDGTLPAGFAGCEHWLWPTQPLAAVPRIGGERVVLVGAAVVGAVPALEPRFPALAVECELVQTLNAFQVTDALSRLCGRPVPLHAPAAALARAA